MCVLRRSDRSITTAVVTLMLSPLFLLVLLLSVRLVTLRCRSVALTSATAAVFGV